MSNAFKAILNQVAAGETLSEETAKTAFDLIMSGQATDAQIAGFLMALRVRGETLDEIVAATRTMREKMNPVQAPTDAIDIVGTGGDGKGSLNISTATALVVAGCGVTVAKHGNKALSSKSGAADVLSSLGVNMQAPIPVVEQAIAQAKIGFMMAPLYHSAMKYVGHARTEMGVRTIFNVLGPLSNPAGVKRQMTGVFAPEWTRPLAEVLGRLGSEKVWVVHGSDGMDELTLTGTTQVAQWDQGALTEFVLDPRDYGFTLCAEADLQGGDSDYNAAAIHRLLDGEHSAYRDVVLWNAAASLNVAGVCLDLNDGIAKAAQAIDSGAAKETLATLIRISETAA